MSVILIVEFKHSVTLRDVVAVASSRLREILNISFDLLIYAQAEFPRSSEDQPNELSETSVPIVCSIARHEAQVLVRPLRVPPNTVAASDSDAFDNYLAASCHMKRTALAWALAAGVAAGLATLQRSDVTDDSGFFTKVNEQSPNEFCRTLRIPTPQQDVEEAAAMMYAAMPKSAEISEWLANN